ncbi:MAG: hypothetical protein II837_05450, partial [Treponema sp.]|nr:hypothetical protein [Treponema sp.]
MNKSLLREKIVNNWKEKILCFVIAIGIYAIYQTQRFKSEEFTVPLKVKAPGNLTVKSGYPVPQYVTVSVRTDKDELAGISSSNMETYIDLGSVSAEGSYDFIVNVQPDRRLSALSPLEISVHPQKISVEVEDEIVRYVPVTPLIADEPAHGYEKGNVFVNPASVMIQGPRSAVEGLTKVQTE